MPLGKLQTKEEIEKECKNQVFKATQVCTDLAYDAHRKEQDRILKEYLDGAPGGYPPSRYQAGINRIQCEDRSPYGCPNPSGYPNLAEEARGRAACRACQDQYDTEVRELQRKYDDESRENQRKLDDAVRACDDKRAELLAACINRQGGPIPSSPTTAPIVPVPTSPVGVPPTGGRPDDLDRALERRTERLYGPIPM